MKLRCGCKLFSCAAWCSLVKNERRVTPGERIVTSAWADARPRTEKTRRDIHSNSAARWSRALVHSVDIVMEFVNEVFGCKWIGLRVHHLPASQEWPPWCPQFDVGVYETRSAQKRGTYNRLSETRWLPLPSSAASVLTPHLEANNSLSQKWVVHMESSWRKWDPGSRM
jgi:hypothetical protein